MLKSLLSSWLSNLKSLVGLYVSEDLDHTARPPDF